MVKVAMFDEVDEGAAIFKISNDPPTQGHFVSYEGLPSDWYLRLTGEGAKLIRGERRIRARFRSSRKPIGLTSGLENGMRLSRTLAVVLGILVPIAETVRRWNTWQEAPLALFDDYILAALVLYGTWLAGHDFRRGQCFLAAAWGIACGVAYGSFFGQLERLRLGEPDPAPIPSSWVAIIKGVLLFLAILALTATLRAKPRPSAFCSRGDQP
jgi:hypothetical protein